jgi:O-antigen/teichoic acid export membrane protein
VIFSGASVSIVVRILGLALSYGANIVLSRLLGLSAYGQYAIALSWVLVLTLPAKAGFDNSTLRYATLYIERNDQPALMGFVRFAVAVVVLMSMLVGTLILLFGHLVARAEFKLLLWAALLVAPLALLALFSALMRASGRIFPSQAYDQLLRPLLLLSGAVAFAWVGTRVSASGALMLTTLAAAGALVALVLHSSKVLSNAGQSPNYAEWRMWAAIGVPMLLMSVVQELMNHLEIILLGILGNQSEAGLFAASWRLASFVPFVFIGLATVAGPMIVSAYHRSARDELVRVSMLVSRIGVAFAVVSAAMLLILGRWLLGLFGPEFVAAYGVLAVLLIGGVANAFTGVAGQLMILTEHERPALLIFAGALLLSIILNMLLIPQLGALGAAIASASATSAWNLAMLVYVRRKVGIDASALALAPHNMRV